MVGHYIGRSDEPLLDITIPQAAWDFARLGQQHGMHSVINAADSASTQSTQATV